MMPTDSIPLAATPDARPKPSGRRDGLFCAAVVILALLILHPAVEMAFVDEWSYAKSALTFASTGHFAFYGASAMVGWQILWGALAIKLFGFSFTALRSSMLPFAFGTIALFHACLRRLGIARPAAILGALTLGFSPIFLPLASSFMTDTGALFGVLVCLWMCLRAIDASTEASTARGTIFWLAAATLANLLFGTDRQIVWFGALIIVPSTAWLLRKRPGVLPAAALLWIVSIATVLPLVRWFSHQVGVQPARLTGPLHFFAIRQMLLQFFLRGPLCLILLVLPAAVLALAQLRDLPHAARRRTIAVTLLAAIGYAVLAFKGPLEFAVMPWLLPLTGNLGIMPFNDELPGVRETALGLIPRTAISLLVLATFWALLEHVWAALRNRTPLAHPPILAAAAGWQPLLYTLGPFSAVYLVLLLPTELFGTGFFDRYLLFLLPLAIAAILKLFPKPLPRLAFFTLALTGTYVVLATHDWYALLRARLALVDNIRATGVPRTAILGGWEYDAWTQMQAQGFLNYRDMVRPPGQTYTTPPERKRPCERGLVNWTPAIDPQYAVVYSPIPCFAPSPFPTAEYRTWLPPLTRRLSVQRIPGYGDAPNPPR